MMDYSVSFVCCSLFVLITIILEVSGSKYQPVAFGEYGTTGYSLYIRDDCTLLSTFHDIPLYADEKNGIFNMVVEIPRGSVDKLEIDKDNPLNPIKHDVKNGKIRKVKVPYPHNYGAFPQTWEKPSHTDINTGCVGDNDPIDVVEIGTKKKLNVGDVVQVKVLGIFALVDEGETDWKVMVINVDDDKADQIKKFEDVERVFPSVLTDTVDWFKNYKAPEVVNKIGMDEKVQNRDFAITIITETHKFWKELVMSKSESSSIHRENVSVNGSPFKQSLNDIVKKSEDSCKTELLKYVDVNKPKC